MTDDKLDVRQAESPIVLTQEGKDNLIGFVKLLMKIHERMEAERKRPNMAQSERMFGYQLSTAYSLNYRQEHTIYLNALKPTGRLYLQLKNNNAEQPIDAGLFIWHTHPEELVTLLTLRAVTGLESFLPLALAMFASLKSGGKIDKPLLEAIYDPRKVMELMDLKFPAHKFAKENRDRMTNWLYRCLPLLVGVDKKIDRKLYSQLLIFYDEIRNKLAHGSVVISSDPDPLLATYELIEKVYLWIETWMPTGMQSGGFKINWR